jgi:hypothetical protein
LFHPEIIQKNQATSEEAWSKQLGFPLKLREYSIPEVESFRVQLESAFSPSGEGLRSLNPEEESYILNELIKCSIDFKYFANRYCFIHTDDGRLAKVSIWPSQLMLIDKIAEQEKKNPRGHVYVAALKGRQEGITTISQMIMAHRLIFHEGTRALAASNVEDKTFELYQFLNRIYDHLPGWMKPGVADKVKSKHIVFPKLRSKANYAWSNQADPIGQGQTLDFVHLTEVSTWTNPGYIKGDIEPAFSSSKAYLPVFIAESTGEGAKGNYFADLYLSAAKGKGEFIPLFISVFDLPGKYSREADGIEFSETTKAIAERVKRETGRVLTKEQMAWYQVKRESYEATGQLELFFQEFPTTEQEAFQVGLKSVFSLEFRSKLRSELRVPESVYKVNPNNGLLTEVSIQECKGNYFNKLVMWKMAEKGSIYVVGVDGSWGLGEGHDNSAIEVIKVGTKEHPDEQVAEFIGDFSPSQLAHIAYTIGNIYEDSQDNFPAMIACEANPGAPSAITQEDLIKKGYPHFYNWKKFGRALGDQGTEILGWYTSASSRPALTQTGVEAIKNDDLRVNSPYILEEMATYVAHQKRYGLTNLKHLGHADGYHDDGIMALFIAYYCAHEKDLSVVVDDRKKFKKLQEAGVPQELDPREYDVGMTFADFYGDRWDNYS